PQHIAEPTQSYPIEEEVTEPADVAKSIEAIAPVVAAASLYEHFLAKLAEETARGPVTADALQERLELNKSQLADWLKRGVSDSRIEKLSKPVRYQLAKAQQPTWL